MPSFTIIVPVYNRPGELKELLQSLVRQTLKDFEVIIVEDGSEISSESLIREFNKDLDIKYYFKENTGPGDSRNYGCIKAQTDFFLFFDSDCIISDTYFECLQQKRKDEKFDAFGGPDRALDSFTDIQKAINFSMTSLFTTGGIRGKQKSIAKFHPRSFNMGIGRQVFKSTGGFSKMRFGEDIDLSIRIIEAGFKAVLIEECYVFHKRRTDFKKFFKQIFNSGIARVNLFKRHRSSLKLVHFFPSLFTIYFVLSIAATLYLKNLLPIIPLVLYWMLLFLDALVRTRHIRVAALAVVASHVQLFGYGLGFLKGCWRRIILGEDEFHDFDMNFYS